MGVAAAREAAAGGAEQLHLRGRRASAACRAGNRIRLQGPVQHGELNGRLVQQARHFGRLLQAHVPQPRPEGVQAHAVGVQLREQRRDLPCQRTHALWLRQAGELRRQRGGDKPRTRRGLEG